MLPPEPRFTHRILACMQNDPGMGVLHRTACDVRWENCKHPLLQDSGDSSRSGHGEVSALERNAEVSAGDSDGSISKTHY